ncbi:MAG TPA: ATP-binding cassette domain-containing protein [Baekduia sp.]|uniref:ABC transporter permease subunit n=1 Tax=Baekduia sp. TaxID=2600305 RepID=UPI002D79D8B4|nr:ATP-binding cassette domain-containing protein [Baekduia sp.]HET6509952.1 ATP-binding cassette domain-containing protein [Baekduia sp.]
MSDVILFALLGAGTGALYSLAAFGVVLTYRASNVVNFASGAVGMIGTFVFWELREQSSWPAVPAALVGVLVATFLGWAINAALMRPLRDASNLTRLVATLATLVFIQGAAKLHYPIEKTYVVRDFLPTKAVNLLGVSVGSDRLILIGAAAAITAATWAFYKYTRFGLATSAIAENRPALATLGWAPERIASINWAVGGALAGLAGILLSPIVGLSVDNATNLIVPALAAAVIGNLRSFPLTLLGGMLIGVSQTEATRYVDVAGIATAVPFVAIILVVVLRGRRLPLRSEASERLPRVTAGQINVKVLAAFAVIMYVLIQFVFSDPWVSAMTVSLVTAVLLLSIVLVTGYAGQVSLAQWAIAGLGALVMAKLVVAGLPFWAAILLGTLAGIPIGVVVGLPALRARGISLAIATLGLGVCVDALLLRGSSWTGGEAGLPIGFLNVFGLDLSPGLYPKRFALFVLVLLIVVGVMLANLRRGTSGRRMVAMRANERAAASLGIAVQGTKLMAFSYAACIAALGGILTIVQFPTALFNDFGPFDSIQFVSQAVIGGVGYLAGPGIGASGQDGGIVSRILADISPGAEKYGPVIFAGLTLVALLRAPSGLLQVMIDDGRALGRKLGIVRASREDRRRARVPEIVVDEGAGRAPDTTLRVEGLTVKYGSVTAVEDIGFTLRSGEVLGIIGPNGAGKTTLIDAITGFTAASADVLSLDGEDLRALSVRQRSRNGVGRSFQSLELFEDMSVAENLLVAGDTGGWGNWVRDLAAPRTAAFTPGAAFAIREFSLQDTLHELPSELSYGRRRLLAIVRTIAMGPRVILLDEPAAGLDQQEREELAVVIRRLADEWNMAVLLIEHDVQLVASVSDRMLALDFGREVILDTPDAVRSHPAVVRSYLGGAPDDEPELVAEAAPAS